MSYCKLGYLYHYEKNKMNKSHIIRDYISEDFEEVLNLWILTGMGGKERKDNHEVIINTIENGGKLIILENGNKIIGTSWLTTDNRRIFLHHFGIHPDFQGQGLSHVLMNATMEYIKEKGMQVKLEVQKDNFKALNLYKKYKFIDFTDYELMMKRDI